MNQLMRPVGPESPSVYWRRRALAVAVLVVVLLIGFLAVRSLFGGGAADATSAQTGSGAQAQDEQAQDADATDADAKDAVTEDADTEDADAKDADAKDADTEDADAKSAGDAASCDVESLQVTATADAGSYAAGSTAKLGVSIRNVGDRECSLDAGSAAVEVVVRSGDDRIWSSDDCQEQAVNDVQVVPAGAELASSVTWSLERSAKGCPKDLAEPKPGTYQLTGRVGEIVSNPLVFTIS